MVVATINGICYLYIDLYQRKKLLINKLNFQLSFGVIQLVKYFFFKQLPALVGCPISTTVLGHVGPHVQTAHRSTTQ